MWYSKSSFFNKILNFEFDIFSIFIFIFSNFFIFFAAPFSLSGRKDSGEREIFSFKLSKTTGKLLEIIIQFFGLKEKLVKNSIFGVSRVISFFSSKLYKSPFLSVIFIL